MRSVLATLGLAAITFAPAPAQARVDLRMNLYVNTGPELVGPESTMVVGVGQTVRFVLLAEMDGGPAPAFSEFTADLFPFDVCGGLSTRVVSFSFGEWPQFFEQPTVAGGAILGGLAVQVPLLGPVDDSNPLVVCTFDVAFDGPDWLIYRASANGTSGYAFGAIDDANWVFATPERFASSVFRSVRVIAVGSPGDPIPCSVADLAPPYGTHDLADVQVFINSFIAGQCRGDVAPPWAILDLADVQRFVQVFVDGCP
ncbi:MAG: hypothetical protein H6810_07650 [Phycisphaeraceae bacterium]|nr:MAG: hypothetical protein H6810_07650 [Phycisphaeraceae bacterium]